MHDELSALLMRYKAFETSRMRDNKFALLAVVAGWIMDFPFLVVAEMSMPLFSSSSVVSKWSLPDEVECSLHCRDQR